MRLRPETEKFFFGREVEIAELCGELSQSNIVPVLGTFGEW